MVGEVPCPYCGYPVVPRVSASGGKVCPRCNNTGQATAQEASWEPPPQAQPLQNAPGAVPSLVLGILGIVIPYVGWILAIIALVQAKKARQALALRPGAYAGDGMAKAGRILGIIGICLGVLVLVTIILASVVFVLVSNISSQVPVDFTAQPAGPGGFLTVDRVDSGVRWSDLSYLPTSMSCSTDSADDFVDRGERLICSGDGALDIYYRDIRIYSTTL